jgi:hypothetical protein
MPERRLALPHRGRSIARCLTAETGGGVRQRSKIVSIRGVVAIQRVSGMAKLSPTLPFLSCDRDRGTLQRFQNGESLWTYGDDFVYIFGPGGQMTAFPRR